MQQDYLSSEVTNIWWGQGAKPKNTAVVNSLIFKDMNKNFIYFKNLF